jgi:pimeloyl-[acyl-carrier protein] synthase
MTDSAKAPTLTRASYLDDELTAFLSDPSLRVDPYPFYRKLREQDPVHRSATGMWFVTGYDGCHSLVRDPVWSRDQHTMTGYQEAEEQGKARRMINQMVLFRDPPDHTRLRALISRVFSRKGAEAKRPVFAGHITALLDELEPRGHADFLGEVGRIVPMMMICDTIGLPQERYDDLQKWTDIYVSMLELDVTPEMAARGDQGFAEFTDYVAPLIEERRRNPREDLLSDFVAARDKGLIDLDEIAGYCLFLLVAGHETTTHLVTNGVRTLLTHPESWAELAASPDDSELKATLVEEVLRYESSGRALLPRWPKEDVELDGKLIPKGSTVVGIESAANRDPAYFRDPETFDVRRKDNPHLAFGGGPHLCSGAWVSRVEAQEVLSALAKRFPGLRIDGDVHWDPAWIIRALTSLPIRWDGE